MSGMIYTGGGFGGSLPDIPARDLSKEEVELYGEELLLESGLYEKPKSKKVSKMEAGHAWD